MDCPGICKDWKHASFFGQRIVFTLEMKQELRNITSKKHLVIDIVSEYKAEF